MYTCHHLISPLVQDVQFFREASDVQFDETGNRKRKYRYGDEDEIELEQQERKRRQLLNREFKAFAEKIAEAATSSVSPTIFTDLPLLSLSVRRHARGRHSFPRAVFRGCTHTSKRPPAANNRMSRTLIRPSVPCRHSF